MKNFKQKLNRIKFLKSIVIACSIFLFNSCSSPNKDKNTTSELVSKIVGNTIGIDTHNHVDVPLNTSEMPGPKVNLTDEMTKSGLSAICMTFAVDYQKLNYEGEAWERFLNGLAEMDTILINNGMKRSYNVTDVEEAHRAKKPTVIQSVEGGHFLEGKIERLQIAYNHGLRHLGLLHDNDASVPLGDVFTNEPRWGGLTEFGAQVIKECERLGILVDLSHCDDTTIDEALKIATKPVIVSHTGLNTRLGNDEFMAKMMKPRLISAEEAKKIADAGGIIGVWTHLTDTVDEYADNIKAMVEVVGIDHVAIGTDTKLTPAYHSPNEQNKKPHNEAPKLHREQKQNNKEPKRKDGENTNKIWSNQTQGFYYALVEALLKKGFNEEEIGKICGGNYLRIFNIATQGH